MSKAARSVYVFGLYLVLAGTGFMFMPNTVLSLVGLPATSEPWVRVVAMLTLLLAFYYIQAARSELKAFFRFTVTGRLFVVLTLAAFVLLGIAQFPLIGFGVVDLLGAIWTASALRNS